MIRLMHIEPHAVDRFHERWASNLTREDAEHELSLLAAAAVPTKEPAKGHAGGSIWKADGGIRLVVKQRAVVTVLPPNPLQEQFDEEAALAAEEAERRAAEGPLRADYALERRKAEDVEKERLAATEARDSRIRSAKEVLNRYAKLKHRFGAPSQKAVAKARKILRDAAE